MADDGVETELATLAGAIGAHLASQPARLERLLDDHRAPHRDRMACSRSDTRRASWHQRRSRSSVPRHENHRRVRRLFLDPSEHGQAVAVRQPVVEQHQIGTGGLFESGSCSPGLDDRVTFRRSRSRRDQRTSSSSSTMSSVALAMVLMWEISPSLGETSAEIRDRTCSDTIYSNNHAA